MKKKEEIDFCAYDNEQVIGRRFGKLTAVAVSALDPNAIECRCDCGQVVTVNKGELLACKILSCDECKHGWIRRYIVRKYGKVTDFDYGPSVELCACCGTPHIWAKGLCRTCYIRTMANADKSISYAPPSQKPRKKMFRNMSVEERAQVCSEMFSPSPNNANADEMIRMYVEDGKTYTEIGKAFGISRQRVYTVLHAHSKK